MTIRLRMVPQDSTGPVASSQLSTMPVGYWLAAIVESTLVP
jgi:hypothetical protein